jgi:hypothetical protein
MSTNLDPAAGFGEYLISARSFVEYTAMFALTSDDLRGSVLDCPGGGASFTATACARGVEAMAIDPAYAMPPEDLSNRLALELERGAIWARERSDAYVWDFYGGPADHATLRAESAQNFVADYGAHRERYLPAALPHLPLGDAAIKLVLSSHLLFTYADRLDHTFHLAALREMARVARDQVRVYPLVDLAGRPLDELVTALVQDLESDGLRASVRAVDYEFQRGARHMLVIEVPDLQTRWADRGQDGTL